ncbi:MAG: hypothetical protein KY475_26640 [Planctomycetes bacterium]|nr:hypothetical protein [Planctomycetota bacterium]
MAIGLDAFAEHLKSTTLGDFEPRPYYEAETDSLIYYARHERSYAHRINKHLTVFLAMKDKSLVGIEIKGVNTILKAIEDLGDIEIAPPVQVKDEDGQVIDLSIMVRCALVPQPESEPDYGALNEATRGVMVMRPVRGSAPCSAH